MNNMYRWLLKCSMLGLVFFLVGSQSFVFSQASKPPVVAVTAQIDDSLYEYGNGSDGSKVVQSGEVFFGDDVRAPVASGIAQESTLQLMSSWNDQVDLQMNLWPKTMWADTGLTVQAGDVMRATGNDHGHPDLFGVCYNASACYDGNGGTLLATEGWLAPGLPHYSVVGRIGNGQPFFIGHQFEAPVAQSGRLYIGLNDCIGCFWDNGYKYGVIKFTYNLQLRPRSTQTFQINDLVLVIQMRGTGYGNHELHRITNVVGNSLILDTPLDSNYFTNDLDRAQVIRIAEYSSFQVKNDGLVVPHHWGGFTGGVIAFLVQDELIVEPRGRISSFATGFAGGKAVTWEMNVAGFQGESPTGSPSQPSQAKNGGAPGGGLGSQGNGGSYAELGGLAYNPDAPEKVGELGDPYGEPTLSNIFLGSGGSGASHSLHFASNGGRAGGIIFIISAKLTVQGIIDSNGQGGWQGHYGGENFAPDLPLDRTESGGGGSGGSIKIVADTISLAPNSVSARGGPGGKSLPPTEPNQFEEFAGDGSVGRIRIEACDAAPAAQLTVPPASSVLRMCDRIPPTVIFVQPDSHSQVRFGMPLTLQWDGFDDPEGSGLLDFTLEQSLDGGVSFQPVLTELTRQYTLTPMLSCHSIQYRVTAQDRARNLSTPAVLDLHVLLKGDFDGNTRIDQADLEAVSVAFQQSNSGQAPDLRFDLSGNQRIDAADTIWLRRHVGDSCR